MGFSPAYATEYSLSSEEGALVSVAIRVEPRRLETLLEALAQVAFPINPQIYHEAEIEVVHLPSREAATKASREATEVTTLVEFPAYLARVEDVFRALQLYGFDRRDVLVTGMLPELRGPNRHGSAPPDTAWKVRARQRSTSAH